MTKRENLEQLERLEQLEQLEQLRHHQIDIRRGISGYIIAKRIYPKSMKEGVDYESYRTSDRILGFLASFKLYYS